jgi:hypothetical protein
MDRLRIVRTVEMETFVQQRQHHNYHDDKSFGLEDAVHKDPTSHNHVGGVQVRYLGDGDSSLGSRSPDRFKSEDEAPFAHAI